MPLISAAEDRSLAARVVTRHALAGATAGSALLAIDKRLLVVHDDAFRVSWIEPPTLQITPLVLTGHGRSLAKLEKPDFEAAVGMTDGGVYVLGSGSTERRHQIARIDLARSTVVLREHAELYRRVHEALGRAAAPNIEGAVVRGERLRLFHRGCGGLPSAVVDVDVRVLDGGAPHVHAVATFDLGELDGTRLAFTDAAAVSSELVLFVAAAENAPDAIADGPVAGSAVGLVEETQGRVSARWTRLIDADGAPFRQKVEGIAIDDDRRGAWVLTDPDDPGRATELARVELRGFS